MLVVHLNCTQKFQVPFGRVLVVWVRRPHLEQAIDIALVDDPQDSLAFPLYARTDNLDGLFTLILVPLSVDEIAGDPHVEVLCFGLLDAESLGPVVKIELVGEVGREQVGDAGLAGEAGRESLDSELELPFDHLPVVFGV